MESLSKRMFWCGIIGPILSALFVYAIGTESNSEFWLATILLSATFALTAVFISYYYRITFFMLGKGIKWTFITLVSFFENLSLGLAGIFVIGLGAAFACVIAMGCFVIAIGPCLAIPIGGIWVLVQVLPESGDVPTNVAVLGSIINIAWLVVFHFLIPILVLRGESQESTVEVVDYVPYEQNYV